MQDPNRAQLEAAVRVLQPLLDELVFAGGCASGRWPTRLLFPPGPLITDPASGSVRPTMDVDVITEPRRTSSTRARQTVTTTPIRPRRHSGRRYCAVMTMALQVRPALRR